MTLNEILLSKRQRLLSIYFTAGFPQLESLPLILSALQEAGVDFVEIGIPYSDPICDGPVIQSSNDVALSNGMTLALLFDQLKAAKSSLPIVLMGYYNSVLQYGIEQFCRDCQAAGVQEVIFPDLPAEIYEHTCQALFEAYGIGLVFLVTPQTSSERIRLIDKKSTRFIYAVSTASTTGSQDGIFGAESYLQRLKEMNLSHPFMVGFNIRNSMDFDFACQYGRGGIIGSAFINKIKASNHIKNDITEFIKEIKQQ